MNLLNGMTSNKKKVLIVGFGSIGKKHYQACKKIGVQIFVISRSKKIESKDKPIFITKSNALKLKFSLIILCNNTNEHISDLFLFYKCGQKILVEKPLHYKRFEKNELLKLLKMTKVYVGYNLRHLEIVKFLKKTLSNKQAKLISTTFKDDCRSWYKNRNINDSYVLNKQKGGGALLTNYHEIDYIKYILSTEIINIKCLPIYNKEKYTADISNEVQGEMKNNVFFKSNLEILSKSRERIGEVVLTDSKILWDIDKGKVWNEKKEILFDKETDYPASYMLQINDILNNSNPICSTLESNINDTKKIFR